MARRWRDWPSLLLLLLLLHGDGEVGGHVDPLHRFLALHSHTRDVSSDLLGLLGPLPLPISHVPQSVRLPRRRLLGLRVLSRYLTFLSLFASLAAASLACESSRATIVTVLSLLHVTGGLGESLTLISNLGDPTFSLLRIEVSSDQVVSGDFLSLSPCLRSTCLKSTCLKSPCLKSPCLKSPCLKSTWLKST